MNQRGFTLIEILVVVAIIGLLASIALVSLMNTRQTARSARVNADFHQIQTQIELARVLKSKTVLQITGNGCSDCAFRDGQPIRSHAAADLAALALSWNNLGFATSPTDPWGTPYMMDENEHESGIDDCRHDQVWTAGPNGIDDGGGGDDIAYNINFFLCKN